MTSIPSADYPQSIAAEHEAWVTAYTAVVALKAAIGEFAANPANRPELFEYFVKRPMAPDKAKAVVLDGLRHSLEVEKERLVDAQSALIAKIRRTVSATDADRLAQGFELRSVAAMAAIADPAP